MSIKTGIDLPRQLGLAILALLDRADLETLLGFIEERAGALDAGTGLTGEDVAAVQLVLSWTLDELALPGGTDLVHLAGRFAHLGEFDWPIALEKACITLSPPRWARAARHNQSAPAYSHVTGWCGGGWWVQEAVVPAPGHLTRRCFRR